MVPKTPESYCDVFNLLEKANVPYVVVSGAAVALHGHARPIYDLDIVASPVQEEQNQTLHALMLAGFTPSIPLPLNLLSVMRLFDQSEREVDLFVKYHIPFGELWSDSVQVQVGESMARVIALEHLLQAKRIVGRPHDLLDVEALLAIHGPVMSEG
jgi:hypothetical protein